MRKNKNWGKMGFVTDIINGLFAGYKDLTSSFPYNFSSLFNIFIFAILIVIYSVVTWKFYKHLSKKDLINLNLNQYNRTTHPFLNKLVAILFYLIEYIIILPFLIFFWFAVFGLFILLLSEELVVAQIVVISASMIAAIRMVCYYEASLALEMAKVFPFAILTIFITSPSFFQLDRVLTKIDEIPNFLGSIILFLLLIAGIELILRVTDTVLNLFRSEAEAEVDLDNI